MIRILILLITLNAIFPVAGSASVCASNMSEASAAIDGEHDSLHSQHESASTSSQSHCNHPDMSCNDHDMASAMHCDSGCCVSCLGVSATLPTSLPDLLSPITSIKPVSGYINFYTRSISPELQPPLV